MVAHESTGPVGAVAAEAFGADGAAAFGAAAAEAFGADAAEAFGVDAAAAFGAVPFVAAVVAERFADELACFEPPEPDAGASPDAARGDAAGASDRPEDATGAVSAGTATEPAPSSEVDASETAPRAAVAAARAAGPSTLAMNFTVTPSTSAIALRSSSLTL